MAEAFGPLERRPHVVYAVSHDLRHNFDSASLRTIACDQHGVRLDLAFSQAPYCGNESELTACLVCVFCVCSLVRAHPATRPMLCVDSPLVDAAPSRNSFFTGRRASVTGVHTFDRREARQFAPLTHRRGQPEAGWTALPEAFARANYSTYGVGITVENFRTSATRCPRCWSDGYFLDWPQSSGEKDVEGRVAEQLDASEDDGRASSVRDGEHMGGNMPVELAAELAFWGSFDGRVADAAVAWLRSRASVLPDGTRSLQLSRPLFLMAGFHGGHKPWPVQPTTHAEYGVQGYTLRRGDLRRWDKPRGSGRFTSATQTMMELAGQWLGAAGGGARSVAEHEALRRGYLVNTARLDSALGRVLAALRDLHAWERTIVLFHAEYAAHACVVMPLVAARL